MYYRNDTRSGFLLPFLAGAIVSPIFLNAIDGNSGCVGQNCGFPIGYSPAYNPYYGYPQALQNYQPYNYPNF